MSAPAAAALVRDLPRRRIRVRGLVQGVGFRPHVWRLAQASGLTGFALNDCDGVLIEVQGEAADGFVRALAARPPPLARIDAVEVEERPCAPGEAGFEIRASGSNGARRTGIAPDTAPCAACLSELFDPHGRRWRHAFISCTDCGPRFTITAALPYDRPQTSMASFPMCPACASEYADPADRRFHAEPIACPDCGPVLSVPVSDAVAAIRAGQIVALKGVGGFQLMCDAGNSAAVSRLRAGKERGGKPFAVMVANAASAQELVSLDRAGTRVLTGPDRPVLLADRAPGAGGRVAAGVAPGLDTLGVMLPSSPLHYLLFHEAAGRPAGTGWLDQAQTLTLVATSANRGGEPLLTDGQDVASALAGLVDLIVDHDRAIIVRTDDPVVRWTGRSMTSLRRGRGQAPAPIRLAGALPAVVALGGYLKTSVCVTRGSEAFLSQHVGDLDDPVTLDFLASTARHMLSILDVTPQAVALDLHPDLPSGQLAVALAPRVIQVQHHHAHAAAVLAEAGHVAPALALSLDGYGYGDDGGAWGGELLRVDGPRHRRLGGLQPLAMPGGERAAREPWRLAAAILHQLGRGEEIARRFPDRPLAPALIRLLEGGAVARTSSCGRWFDAAAGLLGLCAVQGFEAHAAMALEAAAGRLPRQHTDGMTRIDADGQLDLSPLMARIADAAPDRRSQAAAQFHDALADGLATLAARAAEETGGRMPGQPAPRIRHRQRAGTPWRDRSSCPQCPAGGRGPCAGTGSGRRPDPDGGDLTMCLAVPAKLLSLEGDEALADIGGARTRVSVALIDNPQPGEWVVIHTGYALSRIDAAAAEQLAGEIDLLIGEPAR
jgi:hydrogenase maturation protein HypF